MDHRCYDYISLCHICLTSSGSRIILFFVPRYFFIGLPVSVSEMSINIILLGCQYKWCMVLSVISLGPVLSILCNWSLTNRFKFIDLRVMLF